MPDLSCYSRLIFILDIVPETMKIFARLVLSAHVDRTNGVKKTDYNLRVNKKRTRSETPRQKFIRLLHATVLLYRSIHTECVIRVLCDILLRKAKILRFTNSAKAKELSCAKY